MGFATKYMDAYSKGRETAKIVDENLELNFWNNFHFERTEDPGSDKIVIVASEYIEGSEIRKKGFLERLAFYLGYRSV